MKLLFLAPFALWIGFFIGHGTGDLEVFAPLFRAIAAAYAFVLAHELDGHEGHEGVASDV